MSRGIKINGVFTKADPNSELSKKLEKVRENMLRSKHHRELAQRKKELDQRWLDHIEGQREAARNGTLVVWVQGVDDELDRLMEINRLKRQWHRMHRFRTFLGWLKDRINNK